MFTLINVVSKNTYAHAQDADSVNVAVTDTGKRVNVLEWVGDAYSSGDTQLMTGCTLYADANGNYYTNFDGTVDDEDLE